MEMAWWEVLLHLLGFLVCCVIGAKVWRCILHAFKEDQNDE